MALKLKNAHAKFLSEIEDEFLNESLKFGDKLQKTRQEKAMSLLSNFCANWEGLGLPIIIAQNEINRNVKMFRIDGMKKSAATLAASMLGKTDIAEITAIATQLAELNKEIQTLEKDAQSAETEKANA